MVILRVIKRMTAYDDMKRNRQRKKLLSDKLHILQVVATWLRRSMWCQGDCVLASTSETVRDYICSAVSSLTVYLQLSLGTVYLP